jgi:DNA-binding NarL/FixJ family response regulator
MNLTKPTITVLVLDSHAIFREALCFAINTHPSFAVIAAYSTVEEAIQAAKRLLPDIIILGSGTPGYKREEVVELLRGELPDCKLLVTAINLPVWYAQRLMQKGADAYVSKTSSVDAFFEAMAGMLKDRPYI